MITISYNLTLCASILFPIYEQNYLKPFIIRSENVIIISPAAAEYRLFAERFRCKTRQNSREVPRCVITMSLFCVDLTAFFR